MMRQHILRLSDTGLSSTSHTQGQRLALLLSLLLSFFTTACLDSTGPSLGAGEIDQGTSLDMEGGSGDELDAIASGEESADMSITGAEADRELAQRVAFIETELSPRRSYYSVGDTLTLTMRCYDEYGELLPLPELVFTPRPDNSSTIEYQAPDESVPLSERSPAEATATLTPSLEGQGAVRICARRQPDLCGRANYFVDNGAPIIELTSPEEDEVIIGEDRIPEVLVAGTVSGQVALYLNEVEIIADDNGQFSEALPLRFGYNTIEVAADDGFRRPLTRVLRTVLYAPTTLTIEGERVEIPDSLTLRVPPKLLDGDPPAEPPLGELATYTDIAHSLAFMIGLIDPSGLIDSDLSDGNTTTLRVTEASLGIPEVNFIVQDGSIEAFVRLSDLSASTTGSFSLEGINIDLTGELSVNISAYISLSPQVIDGEVVLVPGDSGIAIESVRGVMVDPVAQALIDTLTSAFRLAISGWADQLVAELIETDLPNVLNGQVDSLLSLVSQIEFDISDEDLGLMIGGQLSFYLPGQEALQVSARDGISIKMNVIVEGQPVVSPEEGMPEETTPALNGVPAHISGDIPWPANDEVGFALPLSALNAALYQVWIQGAFNIDLSDQVPAPFNTLLGGIHLSSIRPPLLVDTPVGDPSAMALSMEGLILSVDAPSQVTPPDLALRDDYRLSLYFPLTLQLDESSAEGPELSLALPESPMIRIALARMGGETPVIEPTLIERSVGNLVLPELEDLLVGGLTFPLPSAVIDLLGLIGDRGIALPNLSELVISPRLTELLRVDQGWLVISSGLSLTPR